MLGSQTGKRNKAIEKEMFPHLDALFGYALYLTRKRTNAEELVQDTLLKAVNSFSQYEQGTNCKAWLFRIMHNTFLNSVRKRRVELEFEESTINEISRREDLKTFVRANPNPEESFVNALSRSKVREAVERLPAEFRAVVVLADLEQMAYKEIAEILDCPIGTVMSRLHRGRKLLRVRLLHWAREMGIVTPAVASETTDADHELPDPGNVTPIAAYRRRTVQNGDSKEERP